MLILVVFNSGVVIEHNGSPVVAYDFAAYRNYVKILLTIANGVVNALGFIAQHELGWSAQSRWTIACFTSPMVLLIPAVIAMGTTLPPRFTGQFARLRHMH